MSDKDNVLMSDRVSDPLDMRNYRIEKLPKRVKSGFEHWLTIIGPILAVLSFILFAFIIKLPFLQQIDPSQLVSEEAKKAYEKLGSLAFTRSNEMMLAIFIAGIILWMTEAIPNYLTSLIIIVSLVLTGVLKEKVAYAQLGHPVMWLNIMSFVLASMLVATGVAKRFALWFILKFGKNAGTIFMSFIVINIVLSVMVAIDPTGVGVAFVVVADAVCIPKVPPFFVRSKSNRGDKCPSPNLVFASSKAIPLPNVIFPLVALDVD